MKLQYHITEHAQQRRDHYIRTPKKELIGMMKDLDKFLNFEDFDKGKYRLYYRGFNAIVVKENSKVILITVRGHHLIDSIEALARVRIAPATSAFKTGEGTRVERVNLAGRVVKCGYVVNIPDSEESLFVLKAQLRKKYIMPYLSRTGLRFTEPSAIEPWVIFDDSRGVYVLKDFERNPD